MPKFESIGGFSSYKRTTVRVIARTSRQKRHPHRVLPQHEWARVAAGYVARCKKPLSVPWGDLPAGAVRLLRRADVDELDLEIAGELKR